MAKEDFYNWFSEEAREEINYAVENNMDSALGDRKQKAFVLYPTYYQKKLFKETRKLVWATWFLAVGTLLLSGLTIYLTFFTRAT